MKKSWRWLAALVTIALPISASASGLVDNVNGFTLNDKGKVERFDALLIDDRGKVEKRLKRKDKRPEKLDFRKDGKGRTLMPGIVDAHGHVMALGFRALTLDLSKANSLAEAQAMIAAYAQANPGRRWIIGAGWNQERWGMNRFPTEADIDAILPDTDRKSEEHTSELQSLMRISYAVLCLKQKNQD